MVLNAGIFERLHSEGSASTIVILRPVISSPIMQVVAKK